MARARTKHDLLNSAQKQYDALNALLATLTADELVVPGIMGEWSIKDILAHLAAWSDLAMGWYRAQERGEVVQAPAPGYKWNETPALNQKIYEENRDMSLGDVRAWLERSHEEMMRLIGSLSDEELWTPELCSWSSSPMGQSFVSATASHYEWARSEIRKGLRNRTAV